MAGNANGIQYVIMSQEGTGIAEIDSSCFTETDVQKVLEKDGISVNKMASDKNKWPIIMKGEIVTVDTENGEKTATGDMENGLDTYQAEYKKNPMFWSTEATKRLIALYLEFHDQITDPKLKKKNVWAKITDKLREDFPYFTAHQTESKWNNLLKSHKNHFMSKDKDGYRRKSLQIFSEMEEYVEQHYFVSDGDIYENTTSTKKKKTRGVTNSNDVQIRIIKDDEDDEDYVLPMKRPRHSSDPQYKNTSASSAKSGRSLTDVLLFIHKKREASKAKREREREANHERRHRERMAVMNQILEKLQ